jgi:hypothetical protein
VKHRGSVTTTMELHTDATATKPAKDWKKTVTEAPSETTQDINSDDKLKMGEVDKVKSVSRPSLLATGGLWLLLLGALGVVVFALLRWTKRFI